MRLSSFDMGLENGEVLFNRVDNNLSVVSDDRVTPEEADLMIIRHIWHARDDCNCNRKRAAFHPDWEC